MSSEFTLNAQARADLGKGASRRLRRQGTQTLGIVYGGEKEPTPVTLAVNELTKAVESEAFFTSLIKLSIDGSAEQVVIKDMQRHPAKDTIMHVDFLRVRADQKIVMHVPLHFINEDVAPGVKLEGGSVAHALNDIEISCLPKDLPEYIEVDMKDLHVGDNIHITDLKLPEGVESTALMQGEDHDLLVSAINAPRGGGDEAEESESADAGEEASGDED